MSSVTKYPGTGTQGSQGDYSWADPSNITASDNNVASATAPVDSSGYTTILQGTDFGFAIPTGMEIKGIKLEIERQASIDYLSSGVRDETVKLIKGYSWTPNNYAKTSSRWSTTKGFYSYGGETDLWGTTWDRTDINASNFGAVLQAALSGYSGSATAYVDSMRITVYYSQAPKDVSASLTSASSVQMQVIHLKQAVAGIETTSLASITGNVVKIGGVSVESYGNIVATAEKLGTKDVQTVITPRFYVTFIAEKPLMRDEALGIKMKKEVLYTG